MTPQRFIEVFDTVAEAPGGIERLRELVLHLAVRGRLVPQYDGDGSVSKLLAGLEEGKVRLLKERLISKSRYTCGVPVENEPFVIPSTWRWLRLGDVGAIVGGGTPKSGESSFWSDGQDVPWLTPADMRRQSSRYVSRGERDITSEGLDRSSAQMLPTGSVLFSSRAPIGHVGIAANPLSTNQGFKSCVPYLPAMSEYLYIFLKHAGPGINDKATGTTFKEVAGREFALVPVPVPPLTEQHRIVAKLDELMGLVDRLDSVLRIRDDRRTAGRDSALDALSNAATPEEVGTAWMRIVDRMDDLFAAPADLVPLREAVLQLAVQGRLVPQDADDEPATVLLRKIENDNKVKPERKLSPINKAVIPYRLPSSWTWTRLRQLADFSMGKTPPTKDKSYWSEGRGFPWVSISDMDHFRSVSETKRRVSKKAAAEVFGCQPVPVGTILMSFKLTIGKIARLGVDAYHNEAIVALYPMVHEMDAYLFQFMPLFSSGGSSKGAIKGRTLNSDSLSNLLVALPPLAEQQRIIAKVDQLLEMIDRLEKHLDICEKSNKAFVSAFISNEVSRHNGLGIT